MDLVGRNEENWCDLKRPSRGDLGVRSLSGRTKGREFPDTDFSPPVMKSVLDCDRQLPRLGGYMVTGWRCGLAGAGFAYGCASIASEEAGVRA